MNSESPATPPSPSAQSTAFTSVVSGAVRFAVVSLIAFSIWAFGGSAFRTIGGEPVMYTAIAVAFLGLTGIFFAPLVHDDKPMRRFYAVFLPGFVLYSVLWSACWFGLRSAVGEWLGSFVGSLGFVVVACWQFQNWKRFLPLALAFFCLHSAGYFAGSISMYRLIRLARNPGETGLTGAQWAAVAKLSWGLFYGLGFGAALGLLFHQLRSPSSHAQDR